MNRTSDPTTARLRGRALRAGRRRTSAGGAVIPTSRNTAHRRHRRVGGVGGTIDPSCEPGPPAPCPLPLAPPSTRPPVERQPAGTGNIALCRARTARRSRTARGASPVAGDAADLSPTPPRCICSSPEVDITVIARWLGRENTVTTGPPLRRIRSGFGVRLGFISLIPGVLHRGHSATRCIGRSASTVADSTQSVNTKSPPPDAGGVV